MQYTATLILAVASLAAAQSSTTTSNAATSSATGVNQSGCGGAIDAYDRTLPMASGKVTGSY